MWKKIKPYVIGILIPLLVGGLSALATRNSMDIYEEIVKPPLAPPGAVFPIVWSILFVLMGIGSARVYIKGGDQKVFPLFIYGIQLIVNFFWTLIFFNMQSYLLAFIWLIFLLVLVIYMAYEFYRIDKWAGILQIPYILWIMFAGYLTWMIYLLN
ncbi:MAG: tryptophan-rich sensory protein [Clostridia bacterium]|nr:tryptophan-rich sensory protein [Clostridia bacterium]